MAETVSVAPISGTRRLAMLFVGLDVHCRQSMFWVLDGNGRHLRARAIRGTWDKVLPELAKVKMHTSRKLRRA